MFKGLLQSWLCSMYFELVSVKSFYILNGSGVISAMYLSYSGCRYIQQVLLISSARKLKNRYEYSK